MFRSICYVTLGICAFTAMFDVSAKAASLKSLSQSSHGALKGLTELSDRSSGGLKSKDLLDECIKIDGHWKGECVSSDGKTEQRKMVVVQRQCFQVEVDGIVLNPGGTNKMSSSLATGTSDLTFYPDWTPNEFVVRTQWNLRGSGNRVFLNSIGEQRWRLENSQLITQESEEAVTSVGDSKKVKRNINSCTFVKVDQK